MNTMCDDTTRYSFTRNGQIKDMASLTSEVKNGTLHVKTPLIESVPMSKLMGCQVLLKLENSQPTATFKIRGISNLISKAKERGYTRFVASSGGNAGLAAAYSARKLQVKITIYVPSTTPEFMQERLRMEGADVVVHGKVWDEANAKATEDAKHPEVFNVHPFDHRDIWDGHASMVKEIQDDMTEKPDLLITSVGGGGLALGLLQGLENVGWKDVPLLCMETDGAHCFNAAIKAGKIVTLKAITSIAKCLGALTVCDELFKKYEEGRAIQSELVSDKECLETIYAFLEDHKMLVEPACGAALAAVYADTIKRMQGEDKLPKDLKKIVVVVCGGLAINLKQLEVWKEEFGI